MNANKAREVFIELVANVPAEQWDARLLELAGEDDEVDALYDQIYRELLVFMLNDSKTISRATWLLWVAHNLERVADRATNICERVVFMVTGELVEYNVA